MVKNSKQTLYFPNLNGLRFIAACFVIINHVEQLKPFYGIKGYAHLQSVRNIGKLGVVLFFVLSGFLITYILLSEEHSFGKIHTRKFYIRRFLRIAPLYGLLIFLVFFVLQNFSFWNIPNIKNPIEKSFYPILIFHVLFLSNLTTAIYGFIPYIAQAWSIGTEGQAYLLWPFLLKRVKKNRILLMSAIIILYTLLKFIIEESFSLTIPYQEIIRKFWKHFNIDAIAVGGLFAVLLFQNNSILKRFVHQYIFYLTLLVTSVFLISGLKIPYFHFVSYSFLFGIIIVNLVSNTSLKKVLEWTVINYLGKISYGIYIYHFFVLTPVLIFVSKLGIQTNWLIYPLVLIGTIGISSLSYHYFEIIFLRLKARFKLVKDE